MTSDGTNSYVWDSRNHLASMNLGGETFEYDGYGRRVDKTTIAGTTNYLYDGANVVQELSGSTVTANLLTGLGIDERFTRTDSNGTASFLTDALGSTIELADNNGNSLATYAYEPFGNTTITSGSSANPYQYTGRENDGTGVYFYRGRYYSPTLQRFISEDPIGMLGSGPNLYAYVGNNPIDLRDPTGRLGGADDAVAATAGALLGLFSQAVSDAASGHLSGVSNYVGAAAGGAAAGETFLYTGNPLYAGAAGGFVTSTTTQFIDNLTGTANGVSYFDVGRDTGLGLLTGLIPDANATGNELADQVARGLPASGAGGLADAGRRSNNDPNNNSDNNSNNPARPTSGRRN